jgi:hypothetical protein
MLVQRMLPMAQMPPMQTAPHPLVHMPPQFMAPQHPIAMFPHINPGIPPAGMHNNLLLDPDVLLSQLTDGVDLTAFRDLNVPHNIFL